MSNYDFIPVRYVSADQAQYVPAELAPELRAEIEALDTAAKIRLNSAPQDPRDEGDYFSMT